MFLLNTPIYSLSATIKAVYLANYLDPPNPRQIGFESSVAVLDNNTVYDITTQ